MIHAKIMAITPQLHTPQKRVQNHNITHSSNTLSSKESTKSEYALYLNRSFVLKQNIKILEPLPHIVHDFLVNSSDLNCVELVVTVVGRMY